MYLKSGKFAIKKSFVKLSITSLYLSRSKWLFKIFGKCPEFFPFSFETSLFVFFQSWKIYQKVTIILSKSLRQAFIFFLLNTLCFVETKLIGKMGTTASSHLRKSGKKVSSAEVIFFWSLAKTPNVISWKSLTYLY